MNVGQVTRAARPWLERLGRIGYASKGSVYTIIGLLTMAAALGLGGRAGDQRAAVDFLLRQPFGRILLLVLTIGLLGYALYRTISGFADSENRGGDAKGLAIRTGSTIRGLLYGFFAYEVLRLVMREGRGPEGSDSKTRSWTAEGMDQPLGRWLVAAAGLAILGYAGWQLIRAIRGKLSKEIRLGELSAATRRRVTAISRFGMGARGVVFGIIGGSVVTAAIRHNPGAARGMSGALRELATKPFGTVLFLLAGLGLAAYGVYAFLNAKYRSL
jgi:hypothetical protein